MGVVVDNERAVRGGANIKFDAVGAKGDSGAKGLERVLGGVPVGAAVGDDVDGLPLLPAGT